MTGADPALFRPLALRGTTFRNRIFVSPMCQYSAVDGVPNDWHFVHLGQFATGGAALVLTEASAVVPEGRISAADAGIWNDAQAAAWARVAGFLKAHGAVPGVQLAHAGRKASTQVPWRGGGPLAPADGAWSTVAPSALPFGPGWHVPRALTRDDLEATCAAFVDAARRAGDAGFEVVELHMAHGYLLHQFLSPLTNRRTDEYGGGRDARMMFPLAVARAVRAAWPAQRPLFVRISASDWVDGGWSLDDAVVFARALRECGVDLVDCSSGGAVPDAKVKAGPGYQVPFAAAVRREAGVATGAVGLITEPAQAEEIVASGAADAVLLARALLRDPHWPLRASRELGAEIDYWPAQYLRAR
jgi:2,4-dienoyl-CoA reductase-like NADH-dependent reductase (Old Yellow Enzyme family)